VHATLAEQERMVHLLEGLQALARGEAAESLPREDVELTELVDAALHTARRRHPDTTFALAGEEAEAVVHGWGGGLRLLVDNLLDNAAKHGRPGGHVEVGPAIVAQQVALHGGELRLDDGPLGGLAVRVRLPARPRPAMMRA